MKTKGTHCLENSQTKRGESEFSARGSLLYRGVQTDPPPGLRLYSRPWLATDSAVAEYCDEQSGSFVLALCDFLAPPAFALVRSPTSACSHSPQKNVCSIVKQVSSSQNTDFSHLTISK